MSSYSSRLEKHLKNQAKLIRQGSNLSHSAALEQAAIEFGFSGWKQARGHMSWAENRVALALADLPSKMAELTQSLSTRKGYPYFHEPLTGQRIDPTDLAQCEEVALRILLVGLIDELHAPLHLCRSPQAQIWFIPTLPMDSATAEQEALSWKIGLYARSLALYASKPLEVPSYFSKPTPDDVRTALTSLMRAYYSMSVSLTVKEGIDDVLKHPGFREYVGYALSAAREMNWPTESIDSLLEYSGITFWRDFGNAPTGSTSMLWHARHRAIVSPASHEPNQAKPARSDDRKRAKSDQKLVMDSIGLVAADPKDEPLLEGEALWQKVEMMGTYREENLVEVTRPHLYKSWKEEYEAMGWLFDPAKEDAEDSVREHLEGLVFYRYLGGATTKGSFLADVRKSFYFEPMHIWFKQKLIA
jgi:hypothetical protein